MGLRQALAAGFRLRGGLGRRSGKARHVEFFLSTFAPPVPFGTSPEPRAGACPSCGGVRVGNIDATGVLSMRRRNGQFTCIAKTATKGSVPSTMQRAPLDPLSVGGCDDLLPARVRGPGRTASRYGNTAVAGKNHRLKRPCAAAGAVPSATNATRGVRCPLASVAGRHHPRRQISERPGPKAC